MILGYRLSAVTTKMVAHTLSFCLEFKKTFMEFQKINTDQVILTIEQQQQNPKLDHPPQQNHSVQMSTFQPKATKTLRRLNFSKPRSRFQENHSFDHMLGWMKSLNPEIDGVTGSESNLISSSIPWCFWRTKVHKRSVWSTESKSTMEWNLVCDNIRRARRLLRSRADFGDWSSKSGRHDRSWAIQVPVWSSWR